MDRSSYSRKSKPKPVREVLDPCKIGDDGAKLRETLQRLVIGQPEAVNCIVESYQQYVTGLNTVNRPLANLLFLGPTGSGKTRTVEATAEALVDDPHAVIKIDCAEFAHSHEIAKLLGSPPGYLGHRETKAILSQKNLDRHHKKDVSITFLLFDEIEKASDSLWNLLLGILDKATLTLGDNEKANFSNCMIFLTSNLGSSEMNSLLSKGMGFCGHHDGIHKPPAVDKIEKVAVGAAKRKFTPEFFNRIDRTVVFQSLTSSDLSRILELELGSVQQRLLAANQGAFVFSVSTDARRYLLTEGTDAKYGARHLKRAIERYLVQPLANLLSSGQITEGDWIQADLADDKMHFYREESGLSLDRMAQIGKANLGLAA